MIVVGTDEASAVSRIHIFEYHEESRKWQSIHNIVGIVFDPVHDVAFAPNLGRWVSNVDTHTCVMWVLYGCIIWGTVVDTV